MTAPRPAGPPLARLLAIGYRYLVDGLHEELQRRGWTDVRPAFGFVLLAARDAPTSATALAELMGTTKQAASKLLEVMEAAGYVQRTAAAHDARRRPVRLTPRGVRLLATVEDVYAKLERGWAGVIGAAELEGLRRNLVKLLAGEDGALPPVRPTL